MKQSAKGGSGRGPRRAEEGRVLTGEDTGDVGLPVLGVGPEGERILTLFLVEKDETTSSRKNETQGGRKARGRSVKCNELVEKQGQGLQKIDQGKYTGNN